MFGYVTINKDELKIKDYHKYQSFYCGVCKSLKDRYGIVGQVTLTYDMTFLALLLSSLYEEQEDLKPALCLAHPTQKKQIVHNSITDYAADMNVMLTYYKLADDWYDERSRKAFAMAAVLKKAFKKASAHYPEQAEVMRQYIKGVRKCEKINEQNLDKISAYTGEMLGSILAFKHDEWESHLRKMGFFLGKFIYIMDAYDDIEKDINNHSYNPLITHYYDDDFDDWCHNILVMMAAETAKEFEKMPVLQNAELIRNILYSGLWANYYKVRNQKYKIEE